jgi:zinc/manganese transport system substrate-binding protein
MNLMKKVAATFGLLVLASASLTSCSATPADTSKPTIVATTNVWANVAEQIAGDNFVVTALITDPAQDPHSFEASARDQLAVSESSIFIINGGGYDEFAEVLATAAKVVPFNVYELHEGEHGAEHSEEHTEEGDHSGEDEHAHDGSDHTWYDLHVAELTAELLAAKMSELQPENAEEFTANAQSFAADIAALEERISAFGVNLSYFEAHPLATLLFNELGFTNLTPEGFAEAEEAGLEPSVKIMSDATALIEQKKISFLAVNRQVTSASLEKLKTLAEENGIAVLTFDELLAEGQSYQDWFAALLTELEATR